MSSPKFPYKVVDVIDVEPRGGYRLVLRFSNDAEGERDLSDLVADGGPMVEPLRDPAFFAAAGLLRKPAA
jgi:Protein of unknown function (DUF2442)